jgi:hypothetical protein
MRPLLAAIVLILATLTGDFVTHAADLVPRSRPCGCSSTCGGGIPAGCNAIRLKDSVANKKRALVGEKKMRVQ